MLEQRWPTRSWCLECGRDWDWAVPAGDVFPYGELIGFNPAGEGRVFSAFSPVFDEVRQRWERDPRASALDLAGIDVWQVALSTLLDRDDDGHPFLFGGGPACSGCGALFPLTRRDETRLVMGPSAPPQTTHMWDALADPDRSRAIDSATEWSWQRCRHHLVAKMVRHVLGEAAEAQGGHWFDAMEGVWTSENGTTIVADGMWLPRNDRGAVGPRLVVQVHTPSISVAPPWRPEHLIGTNVVELWLVDLDRDTITVLHRTPRSERFERASRVGRGEVLVSNLLRTVRVPVDRVLIV